MALFKGDIVAFEPVPKPETVGLCRTPSTYGDYSLEMGPRVDEPYIVCDDGRQIGLSGPLYYNVSSAKDPKRSIGWELMTHKGKFYSRIAQYGFEPDEIIMTGVGRTDDIPAANTVGTSILFMKVPELTPVEMEQWTSSNEAEITERQDYDEEVSSYVISDAESTNERPQVEELDLKQLEAERSMRRFLTSEFSADEVRDMCA